MRLLRIVPDNTRFDFMRFRRISFPISAMLSIAAILLYFFHGLNFGIDFVGGTLMEVQTKAGPADLAKMRATIGSLHLGDFHLQQFGAPNDVLIRISEQPGGDVAQQQAVQKVRNALGDGVDYRRVEVVGPSVSTELLSYGTIGLVLAIMAILLYLWFRFEWQFALGAMIANVHDLVLTVGFMSLTRIDFDLTSIAALLTILGYSLNDTVVIYDRIREMLRRYKRMSMPDLLNVSVNATLSRSIVTHVTVAMSLLALLLFGGQAIRSFTATMMFGVVLVGTYTSVFIASPILIYLGVGVGRMREVEEPETPPAPPAAPRPRHQSRLRRAGVPGRAASGSAASAASGADRRPRRRRLPLRRDVASRVAVVSSGWRLGVASGHARRVDRRDAVARVCPRRRSRLFYSRHRSRALGHAGRFADPVSRGAYFRRHHDDGTGRAHL